MCLDSLSIGERLAQQSLYTGLDLRTNATAVEVDRIYLSAAQLGQQVVSQHSTYLVVGHMEGVETHRLDLNLPGFITARKAYPIGLCAAAIGYQYRHNTI
jgi:hypothetical protein